jgi:hypothetical protein
MEIKQKNEILSNLDRQLNEKSNALEEKLNRDSSTTTQMRKQLTIFSEISHHRHIIPVAISNVSVAATNCGYTFHLVSCRINII